MSEEPNLRGFVYRLPDLPTGARVCIDANIFVYALTGSSRQCLDLLQRCGRAEVAAIALFATLNESTHRLMLAEALARGIITRESAASLRRRPADVADLSLYWEQTQILLDLGILLLPLHREILIDAQELRRAYGLLTNDSVLLAAMRTTGVVALATADRDFERIAGLHLFRPDDLPTSPRLPGL